MYHISNLAGASTNIRPLIFDIQNCNSLNLTILTSNFDLEMAAILNGEADIILLSDTRMVSNKGVSSSQRIKNSLRESAKKGTKSILTAHQTVGGLLCWLTAN
jgi:hypothetical protein